MHEIIGAGNEMVRRSAFASRSMAQPPGVSHGADTDVDGWGTIRDTRLYQLVRQPTGMADRTFKIEFSGAGVRAYVFTFG